MFFQIINHEFFLSFCGLVIYFLFLYKRDNDKRKRRIPLKKWVNENGIDIGIGILVAFAVVALDDELIGLYNAIMEHDIELARYMYLLPGPVMDILYRAFTKRVPAE